MYARKRRRLREEPVRTPRVEEDAPQQRTNAAPNSSFMGADASSDPGLAEKMQSRIGAHFPGADMLQRGSGRPLELPDSLRENLESHFGYSMEGLHFRESSDADAIGAKAYARGDEIHFAPGQFRPDTEQGRKMIGHEVSHIRRQASGGMGNGILLDGAQEHEADRDGEAIAMGGESATASYLAPMPTASFAAAPAQGWGLGAHKLLTKLARKKASKYAAEHGGNEDDAENPDDPVSELNKEAYRKITANKEFDSEKAKRSLKYGAEFNDVGHNNDGKHANLPKFLMKYENHRSAFINQSHHGDMQFLHAMDTSNGDTVENMAKTRRYARFASDVYQNKKDDEGQDVQSKNMLKYVLDDKGETDQEDSDVPLPERKKDDPTRFQKMMLSTMLSADKMKEIEKRVASEPLPKGMKSRDEWREKLIMEAAQSGKKAMDEAAEKYEKKSALKKKLAGSKEEYIQKKARKAGLSKYATGTVGDFFTGGNKDLDAGMVALGSASHMIEDSYAGSHASRGENLNLGDGGKKSTDLSETGEEIAEKSTDVITSGDYNQQDAAFLFGRHTKGDDLRDGDTDEEKVENTRGAALGRDAAAQFMLMNAREKYGGEGGANDFLKGILKADMKAASLPGGPTRTGSAYAKTVKGDNDEENEVADEFHKSTKSRAYNVHADASQRAHEYEEQMSQLEKLRNSEDPDARMHYKQQSNEMWANMNSMIEQLEKAKGTLSDEDKATLQALKMQRKKLSKQLNVFSPD